VAAETLPRLQFEHKDWEIARDNTRTCRAAGYQIGDVVPNASVLLTRKAGPHQPVVVALQLAQTADDSATPVSLMNASANGDSVPSNGSRESDRHTVA